MPVLKKKTNPPKLETVELEILIFDPEYQMREELPSIDDYVSVLEDSEGEEWPFKDPLSVCQVGGKLFVVDGFTRGHACKKVGRAVVDVVITKATKTEAFKMALSSNSAHGIPRSRADKRKSVIKAVARWPKLSLRQVAKTCGVSRTLVKNVMDELKGAEADDPKEYEAAPEAAPDPISKKGDCPNCNLDDWKETDGGFVCRACSQPFGEPAGDVDEPEVPAEEPAAEEPAASTEGDASAPWDEDQESVSPKSGKVPTTKPHPQALDLRGELVKQANTELGRLIRTLNKLELYGQLESHVDPLVKFLSKAK